MERARSRYRIQPAEPDAVDRLPGIEVAAAAIFPDEDIAPKLREDGLPLEVFRRAAREGRLWTAVTASAGQPVGFAMATIVGGSAHLFEIDVHPDHGRRGLGAALVGAVMEWARGQGFSSVTLTTFRHLPWNAPYYRRLGFAEIPEAELTRELAEQLDREEEGGLDRSKRVAMRLDLGRIDP